MRGRSGRPKILQRKSSSRLTQRTPAGLPFGIPGMGELIEITVQQAAHPRRHSIVFGCWVLFCYIHASLLGDWICIGRFDKLNDRNQFPDFDAKNKSLP